MSRWSRSSSPDDESDVIPVGGQDAGNGEPPAVPVAGHFAEIVQSTPTMPVSPSPSFEPPSREPEPRDEADEPVPVASRPLPARTRSSGAYVSVAVTLAILIVVLDFIIQNPHRASIHFFTLDFRLPIGVLVLIGVVGGGVIVLLVSLFRVLQLRRSNRRQQKEATSRASK